MKKLALTFLILSAATPSALAADLPSRKAAPAFVPPPPALSWTGAYGGLNLGGGWAAGNGNGDAWNLYGMNGGITNNLGGGVLGGAQVGYNYQLSNLLLVGGETDFQGTSLRRSRSFVGGLYTPTTLGPLGDQSAFYNSVLNPFSNGAPHYANVSTSLNWFGTVRGRVGVTLRPDLLLYATGGFAYGDVTRSVTPSWSGGRGAIQTGWTAGAGVEWLFFPNWSAKAEYLYSDISGGGSNGYWPGAGYAGVGLNSFNNHTRWNTVRLGVNYHFNAGSAPALFNN
jgi:outer membrane immunogenic protein